MSPYEEMMQHIDAQKRGHDDEIKLTEAQAAEWLGVSQATLRTWRWKGKGPRYAKLGGCVRYRLGDVRTFFEKALRTPVETLAK